MTLVRSMKTPKPKFPKIKLPTATELAQLAVQIGWKEEKPECSFRLAIKAHLQATAYLEMVQAEYRSVKTLDALRAFLLQHQGWDLMDYWPFEQEKCLTLYPDKETDEVREFLGVRNPKVALKNLFTWFAAGGKSWRKSSNLKISLTSPKDSSDDATNVNEREYYQFFGKYRCVQYGEDGKIFGEYFSGGEWERRGDDGQLCWKIPISYLNELLEWKRRRKSIGGVKSRQTSGRRKLKKVS